jgi:hypothetical protein
MDMPVWSMPPYFHAMENTLSPVGKMEAFGYGGFPPQPSERDKKRNE